MKAVVLLLVLCMITVGVIMIFDPFDQNNGIPEESEVYSVIFHSNGGSSIESQTVTRGNKAVMPPTPTREGYIFLGWYTNNNLDVKFDFSKEVSSSCELFAGWFSMEDTTDTDGDGLPDLLEYLHGTDINLIDTDADKISDYLEILMDYDPLSVDSDSDGVLDTYEDFDEDQINNIAEIEAGTSMLLADTDSDELSDFEEINTYFTDPVLEDTDGDGANDDWELLKGFDPRTYDASFVVSVQAVNKTENNGIVAKAELDSAGEQASNLCVEQVRPEDDSMVCEEVPGYLGCSYEFFTVGEFESATITFEYPESLGVLSETFQPRIYYCNEEDGTLEELENQTVENGRVIATVTHFSSYVLINKAENDRFWSSQQDVYNQMVSADQSDENADNLCDYYSDLIKSGELTDQRGVAIFKGVDFKLNEDFDGDGLLNGEELIIHVDLSRSATSSCYYTMRSNPMHADSDRDGFEDDEDPNPNSWNVSYRDLALLSEVVYNDYGKDTIISDIKKVVTLSDGHKDKIVAEYSELDGWKVLSFWNNEFGGMQASAYVKDNNLVLAFRGSEAENIADILQDWLVADAIGYVTGINPQAVDALLFTELICEKYGSRYSNIYVTGHSLGGYLALQAGALLNAKGFKDQTVEIVRFNALGVQLPLGLHKYIEQSLMISLIPMADKMTTYHTPNDPVTNFFGFSIGEFRQIPHSKHFWHIDLFGAHSLSNFLEYFRNDLRGPNYEVSDDDSKQAGLNDGYPVHDNDDRSHENNDYDDEFDDSGIGGSSSTSKSLEYELSIDGTYYIVSGIGGYTNSKLTIPSTYKGLPVKEIGNGAFSSTDITSAVIPDSIEHIGERAFSTCYYLQTVTIGKNVKTIDSGAFSMCDKLSNVVIPDSVVTIGSLAFTGCSNLGTVTIGSGVKIIMHEVFASCNLQSVIFKDPSGWRAGNVSIKQSDLENGTVAKDYLTSTYCSSVWMRARIVDGLEYELSQDQTYYIVVGIGEYKDSKLVIPSTCQGLPVEEIKASAFFRNEQIQSLVIPGSVVKIGREAFYKCANLESITFSNGLVEIGGHGFYGCDKLTSLFLPASVESIGGAVFDDCDGLLSITVDSQNTAYKSVDGNLYTKDGKEFVQYAIAKTAESFVIPDGVETINNCSFAYCKSLKSVTIPNTVKKISYAAFWRCTGIITITIPSSVEVIDTYAFRSCIGLEEVCFEENSKLRTIQQRAFYECRNLKTITIPEAVTFIGNEAFYDCQSLEKIYFNAQSVQDVGSTSCVFFNAGKNGDGIEVVFGKAVTKVPAYMFTLYLYDSSYAPKIVSVDFEKGSVCQSIGDRAFYKCHDMASLTFPEGLVSIGWSAFYGCDCLTNVIIPSSVKEIGHAAFDDCDGMLSIMVDDDNTAYKSVDGNLYTKDGTVLVQYAIGKTDADFVIPRGVTKIGDCAFAYCRSLKNVTIPDTVQTIGYASFWRCSGIETIKIPDSVTVIDIQAFFGCRKLTNVILSGSVSAILYSAFDDCGNLKNIYYRGKADDWHNIEIGYGNNKIKYATRNYYSESAPTEEGNFWHYDENGEVSVWE